MTAKAITSGLISRSGSNVLVSSGERSPVERARRQRVGGEQDGGEQQPAADMPVDRRLA